MSASVAPDEGLESPRDRRRKDPAWQQIRTERKIASPHMGRFEPFLVFEAALVFVGWTCAGIAGAMGWLPYWVSVPVAGVLAFAAYMPLHEASHQNIHGKNSNLRWLNEAVGHAMSVLLIMDHLSHQTSHVQHHAHTNDPEKDPDMIYAGSGWKSLAIGLLTPPLMILLFGVGAWIPSVRKKIETEATKSGSPLPVGVIDFARGFQSLVILTLLAAAATGYFVEALLFWVVPAQIATAIISFVFAWLPHHPHNAHGRYTNTRATLFPMSGLVACGHDRHIIHHMIPRIPHHRLGSVFDELRPFLEERGTRIEGSRAGSGAPAIFLSTNAEDVSAIERESRRLDALPFE